MGNKLGHWVWSEKHSQRPLVVVFAIDAIAVPMRNLVEEWRANHFDTTGSSSSTINRRQAGGSDERRRGRWEIDLDRDGHGATVKGKNTPAMRERLTRIAEAIKQITGEHGVDGDEVNMTEFTNLMQQMLTLLRRAKASTPRKPDEETQPDEGADG